MALTSFASEPTSPQLASIAAQRASVERQLVSVGVQLASAQKQRTSVLKQAELVPAWKAPPVVAEMIPDESTPLAALDCEPMAPAEADSLITTAADREDLPADLIKAVIRRESAFKPCALSTAGAQGLMQLMPATAFDLHVNDPFDPKQNIQGGAAYLKQLVNRYRGDLRRALGAYNAGVARVDRRSGIPDILETQNYVEGITGDLGYAQLPVFSTAWRAPDGTVADAVVEADNERTSPSMPVRKEDFHKLTLPDPASVFVSLPDFKRFQ